MDAGESSHHDPCNELFGYLQAVAAGTTPEAEIIHGIDLGREGCKLSGGGGAGVITELVEVDGMRQKGGLARLPPGLDGGCGPLSCQLSSEPLVGQAFNVKRGLGPYGARRGFEHGPRLKPDLGARDGTGWGFPL
jgi:hypothetical protein